MFIARIETTNFTTKKKTQPQEFHMESEKRRIPKGIFYDLGFFIFRFNVQCFFLVVGGLFIANFQVDFSLVESLFGIEPGGIYPPGNNHIYPPLKVASWKMKISEFHRWDMSLPRYTGIPRTMGPYMDPVMLNPNAASATSWFNTLALVILPQRQEDPHTPTLGKGVEPDIIL